MLVLGMTFLASRGQSAQVTYELVAVGDAGNAADTTGRGAVGYEYGIGRYEISIDQYAAFLNAVAASDPNDLYSTEAMGLNTAGIARIGPDGFHTYSVAGPYGITPPGADSPGGRPIAYVTWYDCARFANWMSNGQPTGAQGPTTTEDGAYDLVHASPGTAPAVNATNPNTGLPPLYRIPTENEWYKAAYYKGGSTNAGYWDYATQSNSLAGNTLGSGASQANYVTSVYCVTQQASFAYDQNYLSNVGGFSASPSGYGTFDQTGNVSEWNDLSGVAATTRGINGGSWFDVDWTITASASTAVSLTEMNRYTGFRLVGPVPVPEPSAWAGCGVGLALLAWLRSSR